MCFHMSLDALLYDQQKQVQLSTTNSVVKILFLQNILFINALRCKLTADDEMLCMDDLTPISDNCIMTDYPFKATIKFCQQLLLCRNV